MEVNKTFKATTAGYIKPTEVNNLYTMYSMASLDIRRAAITEEEINKYNSGNKHSFQAGAYKKKKKKTIN